VDRVVTVIVFCFGLSFLEIFTIKGFFFTFTVYINFQTVFGVTLKDITVIF
jgi:ABC-type transporter Mla subunit MlaD